MFALLVIVLFGILFSFFATQNAVGVPVRMFTFYGAGIPLYLVVLLSLFIGVLLSWFLSFFGWASSVLTLHSKNTRIKKTEATVSDLQSRIDQLEKENAQLRGEKQKIKADANEKMAEVKEKNTEPNLLDRFRHNISV